MRLFLLALLQLSRSLVLDISADCGAVGDNSTLNTHAINACVQRAQPGDTVLVPRGVFLTGTVSLRAGQTLLFAQGGWLQGSANASDYGPDWDYWHVVQAVAAPGVRVLAEQRGGGGIVGAMWQMVQSFDAAAQFFTPVSWQGIAGCTGECRPKNLALIDSSNSELRDFALLDSSDWTLLLRRSSSVLVDGLYIRGNQMWGNNDGADIESGSNITLSNLDIATGDDCIAMRSGNCNTMRTPWPLPLPPLDSVRIVNCTLSSSSSAIKVENLFMRDHGNVTNIEVDNVTIYASNRGIGVWQRRSGPSGGYMGNLSFRNLRIETRYMDSPNWWGSGEALVVTSVPEDAAQLATGLPGIHSVLFENIAAVAEGGCLFSARGQAATNPLALERLTLRNVSLTIAASQGRSSSFVHNQLDFRPVDPGGGAPNTVPMLVSGLVFEGVVGAAVQGGSSVTFQPPRQAYWAGAGSAGVCVSGSAALSPDFVCHTAAAAAAAPPALCSAPRGGSGAPTCSLSPGMNNHGVNLLQSAATSAQDCCSQCGEEPGCVGFTYVYGNGDCYLKSAVEAATADSAVESGSLTGGGGGGGGGCTFSPGQNSHGDNLPGQPGTAGDETACCAACTAQAGCVGFTFVPGNKDCECCRSFLAPFCLPPSLTLSLTHTVTLRRLPEVSPGPTHT